MDDDKGIKGGSTKSRPSPAVTNKSDLLFMRRALELAAQARGQTSPNPMVGAVLVKNNKIIAEGWHQKAGEDHAERAALKKAGESARGATLYVTLEPCCHYGKTPPCTDIIIESGVSRVVAAVRDPFPKVSGEGFNILNKAGIQVVEGVLQKEARRLNEVFFTVHEKNRPFVMLKWAMSLDGRTSNDFGHSKWITSEESRKFAHILRSNYDAILVGAGTVIADNPKLTVRLPDFNRPQPACVVLDPGLDIPTSAALLKEDHKIYIVSSPIEGARMIKIADKLRQKGAEIISIDAQNEKFHIPSVLKELLQVGIQSIFVEGGRRVAGSFLEADVVDKIGAFIAPKIIGGFAPASPLICNTSCSKDFHPLKDVTIKCIGLDVYIEAYPTLWNVPV